MRKPYPVPVRSRFTAALFQTGWPAWSRSTENLQMTHHHTDRRLVTSVRWGVQVIAHQVIKRWCRGTPVVRITEPRL